ncbi:MAG TPA: branched-chain amino acid ABC transporter substrate-binding protein [Candidatus Nanopelagicaceae bacterium]|nr:branched-chain amino acid ABC transporter substrate-binding protein [Candidatus Nanopelagicaceae bacterium]
MKISIRSTVGIVAAGALALGSLVAISAPAQAKVKLPNGCKNLTIGFFGALTGDYGNLGKNISQGAELAVAQYGLKAHKVNVGFVSFDSQGDPAQAPALAQQAIKNKCLVGLVGPAFSGESKAADPIFQRGGLPTITPSATNPDLSKQGWKVFHRALGTDAIQGSQGAKYIKNTLKATKVAVIDDASEYGKGLADVVAASLGSSLVVTRTSLDPKSPDFSSTVSQIKAGGATAVFYGGYYSDAGRLVKQLRDSGVKAAFMSGDGTLDAGFVTAGGSATDGSVVTCACAPIDTTKTGKAFKAAYKTRFGVADGTYSPEAYDAANFLLAAIQHGKVSRAAINKYISKKSWTGITKTLKFTKTGEIAGGAIFAYVYKNGTNTASLIK